MELCDPFIVISSLFMWVFSFKQLTIKVQLGDSHDKMSWKFSAMTLDKYCRPILQEKILMQDDVISQEQKCLSLPLDWFRWTLMFSTQNCVFLVRQSFCHLLWMQIELANFLLPFPFLFPGMLMAVQWGSCLVAVFWTSPRKNVSRLARLKDQAL